MNLEHQVVSLELSKRLKELGVKQGSFARWQVWKDPQTGRRRKAIVFEGGYTFGDAYPAFTVAELGEMLPPYIERNGRVMCLETNPRCLLDGKHVTGDWEVNYWRRGSKGGKAGLLGGGIDTTEADARAKMLIYLLENKFTTI